MGFGDAVASAGPHAKKPAPYLRQITIQTPHCSIFTGRMLFLTPIQQCQSTEGIISRSLFKIHSVSWHVGNLACWQDVHEACNTRVTVEADWTGSLDEHTQSHLTTHLTTHSALHRTAFSTSTDSTLFQSNRPHNTPETANSVSWSITPHANVVKWCLLAKLPNYQQISYIFPKNKNVLAGWRFNGAFNTAQVILHL